MLKDSFLVFFTVGALPSIENDVQFGEGVLLQQLLDFSFMANAHSEPQGPHSKFGEGNYIDLDVLFGF